MQLRNNSTTEISLYHDYLFWTKASDSTAVFNEFVRNANFALDKVLRKVYQVDGRWQYDDSNNTTYPIATANLVAAQSLYALADSHIRVTRLRIKNQEGDWVTVDPKDRSQLDDDDLAATGTPECYDKIGGGFSLHPTPDYSVTGGIEVTFQRGSNYFDTDDTTKEPGFASIFHRYISLLPAKDYAATNEQGTQLKVIIEAIRELDEEVTEFYNTRDKDGVESMSLRKTSTYY